MATIDMPHALSSRVMNALKADPCTVDVRAQALQFYTLAARMLDLFEEDEMVDVLSEVSLQPKHDHRATAELTSLTRRSRNGLS